MPYIRSRRKLREILGLKFIACNPFSDIMAAGAIAMVIALNTARRPAARDPLRNPPEPVARDPPPAPVQGGNGSVAGSLGSTIAEGMGFGTGNAIGQRVVDFLMGPRIIERETVVSSTSAAPTGSDACGTHAKAFQDCLNSSGSDDSKCQSYMDMLSECRRKSGATLSA